MNIVFRVNSGVASEEAAFFVNRQSSISFGRECGCCIIFVTSRKWSPWGEGMWLLEVHLSLTTLTTVFLTTWVGDDRVARVFVDKNFGCKDTIFFYITL